jgi:carboxypeptidase family protein
MGRVQRRVRLMLLGAVALTLAPCPVAAKKSPLEDSSFVYGVFAGNPTCEQVAQRLAAAPLRSTVLLSVENGQGFLLDQPGGAELLVCALQNLKGSSRAAKALMLQDTSFLDRQEESERRARLLAEFAAANPKLLEGVLIDIEPYVDDRWSCATLAQRRQIGDDYLALLGRLKRVSGKLRVEAAIPWWYILNDDIPELLPDSILKQADGVYFMVYGDEGGPVVSGRAEKVFARLPAARLPSKRGRSYIALATYESHSPAELEAEVAQVRLYYGRAKRFGGVAIFHARSEYDAPLVRVVSGVVTDAQGNGVASAEVEAAGVKVRTNMCGKFTLKGVPQAEATLSVSKDGYEPLTLPVELADPGRERELRPIHLSPKKK